ncbi:peptide chain release factor N(5)-glutamine methyltransferase [Henriciella aquimarina]|uniref:peptide chain release factor N(5)-glutamine methyltransferase n=1 Tax=Henriciella aquimarina TaxID=545261 RepID=UPI000A02B5C3|nr:peptide chain release factor N(5)-glutamine methyltransferase [Henriciella aquimarina]
MCRPDTTMDEVRTFKAQLAVATTRLKSAGLDKPAREARHLMQHACRMSAADLIREELSEMGDEASKAFFDLVERRAAGEPFEHLTGEAHFYGLIFHCSADTLIPRADSEVVVDEALARLPLGRNAMVADLGTGTGCLLIALMQNQPGLTGVGVERSEAAAAVARQNLQRHDLAGRAKIETMSWEDWTGWDRADLIISNPPYIQSDTIGTLDPGVRGFEPHEALDGGHDGLEAYRSIISLAAARMVPGAWLVLEIGFDQGETVPALLAKAGFGTISCGQDHGQRDRVVCARR